MDGKEGRVREGKKVGHGWKRREGKGRKEGREREIQEGTVRE